MHYNYYVSLNENIKHTLQKCWWLYVFIVELTQYIYIHKLPLLILECSTLTIVALLGVVACRNHSRWLTS